MSDGTSLCTSLDDDFSITLSILLLGAQVGVQPSMAGTAISGKSVSRHEVDRIAFSRQLDGGGSAGFTIDPMATVSGR